MLKSTVTCNSWTLIPEKDPPQHFLLCWFLWAAGARVVLGGEAALGAFIPAGGPAALFPAETDHLWAAGQEQPAEHRDGRTTTQDRGAAAGQDAPAACCTNTTLTVAPVSTAEFGPRTGFSCHTSNSHQQRWLKYTQCFHTCVKRYSVTVKQYRLWNVLRVGHARCFCGALTEAHALLSLQSNNIST